MKVSISRYFKNGNPQKIDVRIDPWDTWSMDNTLAHIIHPMLVQLKATKHGSPEVADEDVPDRLKSSVAEKPKDADSYDSFYHDRWNWVLDEMIWAFEQINKDWEANFSSGNIDWKFVPIDPKDPNSATRPVYGPNHTFKFDNDGYKAHLERMQNGFRLFGKYYLALWD